jgi:hypothetical protein
MDTEGCGFQGEEYKLFWPDQPEFVRMASRFGATIIPFGVVGEDDICDVSAILLLPTTVLLPKFEITIRISFPG